MPIKWKTTQVERPNGVYAVTHWAKHNPHEVLKAIWSNPLRKIPGADPELSIHKIGRHALAVRHLGAFGPVLAGQLFEFLKELADKKVPMETPVAFVKQPNSYIQLVTLWKKKTTPLGAFLKNGQNSLAAKQRACKTAIRKLSALHAAGFWHRHIKPDNFVIDNNGNAHLIDYTGLTKMPQDARKHSAKVEFEPLLDDFMPVFCDFYSAKYEEDRAAFLLNMRFEYDKWRRVYDKRFGNKFSTHHIAGEKRYAFERLRRTE